MNSKEKYQEIFLASHSLFLSQGFEETTIRQISIKAGVSLGLTNHFFHSKQILARLFLNMLVQYVMDFCHRHSDIADDPLLNTSVCTRVINLFLTRGHYRQFYLDCLKHDIFFQNLQKSPNRSIYQLAEQYHFPVDDDLFLLYGQYIPYNMEKTLVLKKQQGLFPTISEEDIPDFIITSKFEHFLDMQILHDCLLQARKIAAELLEKIEEPVPENYVLRYLESAEP